MAHMFGIKPRTLYNWYKLELSGYPEKLRAGTWGEKSIKIANVETGEIINWQEDVYRDDQSQYRQDSTHCTKSKWR